MIYMLKTSPKDFEKSSDEIDKEVVKKPVCNTLNMKVNNLENEIPDDSSLIQTNLITQINNLRPKFLTVLVQRLRLLLIQKIVRLRKKVSDLSNLVKFVRIIQQKIVIKKSGRIVAMEQHFDGAGSQNFGNDLARNVVIFGVDNISSSHTATCKNNFLVLCEVPTYGINGSFLSPDKMFSIRFRKAKNKF